jgi:hypothetical protein
LIAKSSWIGVDPPLGFFLTAHIPAQFAFRHVRCTFRIQVAADVGSLDNPLLIRLPGSGVCVRKASIAGPHSSDLQNRPAFPINRELVRKGNLSGGTFRALHRVAGRFLYQSYLALYHQDLTRSKLLVSLLVLLLSAANSSAASMCAAYCLSSAFFGSNAVHHHQTEPQANAATVRHHTHSHVVRCTECPTNNLSQKPACTSLAEIQALKEGSFSLDVPTGGAQVGALTPADRLLFASDDERSSLFNASPPVRSSSLASLPIRI